MLIRVKKSLFNVDNIAIFNSKVIVMISILNSNKHIVIAQQNVI